MTDSPRTVPFGFREVAEDEKSRLVGRIFSNVASRYDVMNDLMSLGVHRIWKQALLDWLAPSPDTQLLDVAGGTGDIAFRFLDRLSSKKGTAHATVCDINPEMLAVGRTRAQERNCLDRVDFTCGDAEHLPFPDTSFDAYTIAFGIRNVTHIERALSEAYRVLKPGGRFLCLEFSKVDNPMLERLYDLWSFNAIPAIGQAIANDRAAYEYLVESIRRFPPQKTFAAMIETAGFKQVKWRDLSGGIVAMHSGWKF
ncbi:MAG: bifunctional demethylmenaquinone methyltransferase/2-methoxy-6-polyprenyl-1,4-benzoquinol methylase UbiE [Micropepsaceae bacterium]